MVIAGIQWCLVCLVQRGVLHLSHLSLAYETLEPRTYHGDNMTGDHVYQHKTSQKKSLKKNEKSKKVKQPRKNAKKVRKSMNN